VSASSFWVLPSCDYSNGSTKKVFIITAKYYSKDFARMAFLFARSSRENTKKAFWVVHFF
jgi:hypothetical protein